MFLTTVRVGNYRCLPAPYERACLMGDYYKKNKIKGKVVLLDPRERPFGQGAGLSRRLQRALQGLRRLSAIDAN